jgi:hypothetical protein
MITEKNIKYSYKFTHSKQEHSTILQLLPQLSLFETVCVLCTFRWLSLGLFRAPSAPAVIMNVSCQQFIEYNIPAIKIFPLCMSEEWGTLQMHHANAVLYMYSMYVLLCLCM